VLRSTGDAEGEALIGAVAKTFANVFEEDSPLVERKDKDGNTVRGPAFQRERFMSAASADSYPFGK
jgi:hypothetical protein